MRLVRFPVRYTEDGIAGSCEIAPGRLTLDCFGGGTHSSWQYASLSDFIAEPELPNLVLVRQRTWSGGGPMLISYGSHTTVNADEGLRLLTRVRTWSRGSGTHSRLDELGCGAGSEALGARAASPGRVVARWEARTVTSTARVARA